MVGTFQCLVFSKFIACSNTYVTQHSLYYSFNLSGILFLHLCTPKPNFFIITFHTTHISCLLSFKTSIILYFSFSLSPALQLHFNHLHSPTPCPHLKFCYNHCIFHLNIFYTTVCRVFFTPESCLESTGGACTFLSFSFIF